MYFVLAGLIHNIECKSRRNYHKRWRSTDSVCKYCSWSVARHQSGKWLDFFANGIIPVFLLTFGSMHILMMISDYNACFDMFNPFYIVFFFIFAVCALLSSVVFCRSPFDVSSNRIDQFIKGRSLEPSISRCDSCKWRFSRLFSRECRILYAAHREKTFAGHCKLYTNHKLLNALFSFLYFHLFSPFHSIGRCSALPMQSTLTQNGHTIRNSTVISSPWHASDASPHTF